jgi:hypothetical protein
MQTLSVKLVQTSVSVTLFKRYLRTTSFLVCCASLFCFNLRANTESGRLLARIIDPQGVPVVGAHAKLLNAFGMVIRETRSDPQGSFVLDNIDPGEYQLKTEAAPFVSVITDVSVAPGQRKSGAVSPLKMDGGEGGIRTHG